VRGTYRHVALDHAERFPAALLPDGFQIDAGHDAHAGPVMAPVMHMEIDDTGSPASGRMRLFDRAAARHLVAARIAVRLAAIGQENRPFTRGAARNP
jgi:hypothetical protein